MKHCKRMLAVLLILSVVSVLFASCGKDNKGEIVAVYNNTPVYESEVADIINYELVTGYTSGMTESQMRAIMQSAIVTYVQFKAIELDLKEKDLTVDEEALDAKVSETRAQLDETVEGGYDAWKQRCNVSDAFLEEHLRRIALEELYKENAKKEIEVSDDDAYNYYVGNSMSFADPAGYYWTAVLREVLDIEDETECAEVEAEVQAYIGKIKDGSMTMDAVKSEILANCTKDKGYKYGTLFSGSDFTATTSMKEVPDLDQAIADIKAAHGEPVYKEEMTEEEQTAYNAYYSSMFQTEVFYALQHLEPGEIYAKPIKSVIGYYIIRLDSITTMSGFKDFEKVKTEIKDSIAEERVDAKFVEYLSEITTKYNLLYSFS